jgi:hypothetical protein
VLPTSLTLCLTKRLFSARGAFLRLKPTFYFSFAFHFKGFGEIMFLNWVSGRQKIVYINLYNNISLYEISGAIMYLCSPLVYRTNVSFVSRSLLWIVACLKRAFQSNDATLNSRLLKALRSNRLPHRKQGTGNGRHSNFRAVKYTTFRKYVHVLPFSIPFL